MKGHGDVAFTDATDHVNLLWSDGYFLIAFHLF